MEKLSTMFKNYVRRNVSVSSAIFALLISVFYFCWNRPFIKVQLTSLAGTFFFANFVVGLLALMTALCFLLVCFSLGHVVIKFLFGNMRLGFWLQTGSGFILITTLSFLFFHFGSVDGRVVSAFGSAVALVSAKRLENVAQTVSSLFAWIRSSALVSLLLLVLVFFYCACCALQTFSPDPFVDVHFYHLLSAWKWATAGKFYDLNWMPYYMQGGLGEYTYAMLGSFVQDQMALVLTGQMVHFAFGVIGASSLVYGLARKWLNRRFALLALFAYITFPCEYIMLMRAKNDGFVLFYILCALTMGLKMWQSSRRSFIHLFYFFAFFAVGLKHTAAFFIVPFWLVSVVVLGRRKNYRETLKEHARGFAVFVVLGLPILIRNLILSGNPFFPAVSEIFAGYGLVSKPMADELMAYTYVKGSFLEILTQQLSNFYAAKPIYWFGLLAVFPVLKLLKIRAFTWVGILSFVMFCVMTGQGFSIRFMFFMYAILAITSVFVLQKFLVKYIPLRWQPSAFIFLVFLSLANSAIEVPFYRLYRTFFKLYFSDISFAQNFSNEKGYYKVHIWANENLENPWILSSFDNEALFLNGKLSVAANYLGGSNVGSAHGYDDFRKIFSAEGFTHLQINREKNLIFERFMQDQKFSADFESIFSNDNYTLYKLN